jgi:hypothetical protein
MEVKVNMECVVKILEKNGYEIESKDVESGSPITAKKEISSNDPKKIELFQVRCGPPYVKFEAKIDNSIQQGILDTLNQGLNNLVKGGKREVVKETKNSVSTD